jgi:hypothetical protein
MESPKDLPTPNISKTEGDILITNDSPSSIEGRGTVTDNLQPINPASVEGHEGTLTRLFSFTQATNKMLTDATDATISGHTKKEDDVALLARFVRCTSVVYPISECRSLVANALNESVTKLREDNDTKMSQYAHIEHPE